MDKENDLMLDNSEFRTEARERLKGNWLTPILVCFVYFIIVGSIGSALILIIGGPMMLGMAGYFIKFKRDQECSLSNLFDGFKLFEKSLILYLLQFLFILLWSLLCVIPGIIAALRYSLAFYILYDNPELTAKEALNESIRLMDGYKGKLFSLCLSFLGWFLLSILTCGVGFFWLSPYMNLAIVNFYEDRIKIDKSGGESV